MKMSEHDELVIKRIRTLFQVPSAIKITRWHEMQDSYKWFRGGGMAFSWFCSCPTCIGKNKWNPDSEACQTVKKYTKKAFAQSVLFRCLEENASVQDGQRPNLFYIGVNSEQWIWLNRKPVLIRNTRFNGKTEAGYRLS